jgi:hypothetical protein
VAVYPGWQWGPASASDPADGLRLVVWLDGRSQDFFDIPQVYGVLREPEPAEAGFDVFLPLVLKVE